MMVRLPQSAQQQPHLQRNDASGRQAPRNASAPGQLVAHEAEVDLHELVDTEMEREEYINELNELQQ